MARFKMLGRDANASPPEYRTWVVNDAPDFEGFLYTGYKSGPAPLADISAYLILDDNAVADFNYPLVSKQYYVNWISTKKVLPEAVYDAQIAVIGDYVYLFGGKSSNRILRAPLNNPTKWEDTESYLPTALSGSQLAIIGDKVYLFGGEDTQALDTIYSADLSDPLTWTNHGSLLPLKIRNSQLAIINGEIYLFGGQDTNVPVGAILKCSVSNPLSWINTGSQLNQPIYNSHLGIIGDYVYLFGGQDAGYQPTNRIFRAALSSPTNWSNVGSLPFKVCSGQFFTVGDKGYIIAPGNASPQNYQTKVLRCDLTAPLSWINTQKFVPGNVSSSQLAIIYDRIYLFGGNASSVIFTDNSIVKYNPADPPIVAYGNVTRDQYNSASTLDLFKVLGFANWKTDYGS